jgi:hypothetical protein
MMIASIFPNVDNAEPTIALPSFGGVESAIALPPAVLILATTSSTRR